MATLHLRDVPQNTIEQLRRLAERERTSMNAVAVQELIEAAGQVDNPALFTSLPNLDVDATKIAEALESAREGR